MNHEPGSLEEMVENLVKNWEVEASFKPRLSDWRTIDHEKYSFAMGGGPPQHIDYTCLLKHEAYTPIKVGTYNGIIAPNEYYSPENSDFASSHKTFKRMMPTFAWEVLEVYSGPPRVAFRWRHWGVMKNDYVAFNDKGQKVTAKAHGGQIELEGVTVAQVDDQVRLQAIQTWMDPLDMFRQIAPHGVVNKEVMNRNLDMVDALDVGPGEQETKEESSSSSPKPAAGADNQPVSSTQTNTISTDDTQPSVHHRTRLPDEVRSAQAIVDTAAAQGAHEGNISKPESNAKEVSETIPRIETTTTAQAQDDGEQVPPSSSSVTATSGTAEVDKLKAGEAVVADAKSEETKVTREEMSRLGEGACPFFMNME
ncbi:hypothetical protein AC579_8991 [Pseudocercospora musae]|uniref:Pathogen-related protein n=1 Tax=Pseudocercospora musae TaxID=113226 RepID=A0A139I7Z5_9PEZI|nr:hypothetical protein AC579_8991 [Pseudocercospora musae]